MGVWSEILVSSLPPTFRLDAEYYQPKYQENVCFLRETCQHPVVTLGELIVSISGGATPLGAEYLDSGVPFLRVQNIMQGYLSLGDIVYIAEHTHKAELNRSQLQEGDVLLTITGMSYGKAACVPAGLGQANINQHSVRMAVSDKVLPEYIAMFLNSRYGKLQSDMKVTGDTRPALDYGEIRSMLVPVLPLAMQEEVRDALFCANKQRESAAALYAQAEATLHAALGLDHLDTSHTLTYTGQFSDMARAERMDAEHFQPKYAALLAQMHRAEGGRVVTLGSIAPGICRGLQPEYVDEGDVVVVNSQHLGPTQLNIDGTERTSQAFWENSPRAQLKQNDVLLYATGAYVGRTNAYMETMPAVASNHVTIIRPNEQCEPIYLSVFLNSSAGLLQTEQWACGSAQREIYPSAIERFAIFLAPKDVQQSIAAKVTEAYAARQDANALLTQAKQRVEALISHSIHP